MVKKSSKPSPKLVDVAELRAKGASWDLVAEELGLKKGTIKAWPRRYSMLWAKVFGKAKKDLQAEHMAEALHQLRKLLRSEDERMIRDSATRLLQFYSGLSRGRRRKAKSPPKVPKEMELIVTQVGELDGIELDGLTNRLVDDLLRSRRAAAAVEAAPSPAQSQ